TTPCSIKARCRSTCWKQRSQPGSPRRSRDLPRIIPRQETRKSASLLYFFGGFPIGSEFLRDRFQRRIKLHKDMLHGGMLLVTTPAAFFWICACRFCIFIEIEIRPFIGKASFVFHLDADPHGI